jgi:hypothetical protein
VGSVDGAHMARAFAGVASTVLGWSGMKRAPSMRSLLPLLRLRCKCNPAGSSPQRQATTSDPAHSLGCIYYRSGRSFTGFIILRTWARLLYISVTFWAVQSTHFNKPLVHVAQTRSSYKPDRCRLFWLGCGFVLSFLLTSSNKKVQPQAHSCSTSKYDPSFLGRTEALRHCRGSRRLVS